MADNNTNFAKTPRRKNALDNKKLSLKAPCPTAQGKTSTLLWGVYANNPRITVYTGDPEDTVNYGKIVADIDVVTFYSFIEMIENAAKSPTECKEKIDNKGYTWLGGKRSENMVVVNSLAVGKDADGCVWISVIADKRPLIKFFIRPGDSNSLYHGDGRPFTKAESSSLYAIGYCSILRNLVSIVLVNEYVEEAPKKPFVPGGNNYSRDQVKQNNTSYQNEIPF